MKRKVLIVLEKAQTQPVTVEFQAEPAGADGKLNLADIKRVTIPAGETAGEIELPVRSGGSYRYWVKGDDSSRHLFPKKYFYLNAGKDIYLSELIEPGDRSTESVIICAENEIAPKADRYDESHTLDPSQKSAKTDADSKTNDSSVVHKTGNETIDGVKTFNSSPVIPTPATDFQAATKKYVDSSAADLNLLKWVARFTHEDETSPTTLVNKEFHGNFYAGPLGEAGAVFGNRAMGWLAAADHKAGYFPDMSAGGAHVMMGGYDGGSLVTNRIGILGNIASADGYSTQAQWDSGIEKYRIGSWLTVFMAIVLPWWYLYVKGVPVKKGKGSGGADLTESMIVLDYEADMAIGAHNHSKFAGLGSNVYMYMDGSPITPDPEKTAVIRPQMNPVPFHRNPGDGSIILLTAGWDLGSNSGGHYIEDYGHGMIVDGKLMKHPAVPAIGQMFGIFPSDYVNFPKSFYPQYELANVYENETDMVVTPAPSLLVNELFKRPDVTWQNPNMSNDGTNTPVLGLGDTDDSGSLGALEWQRSSKYGIIMGGGDGAGEYGGAFSAAGDDAEFPYIHVGTSNMLATFRNGGNHTPYFEAWLCYDEATNTGIQIQEYAGTLSFKLIINGGANVVNLTDDVSGLHYVLVSPNGRLAYNVGMYHNSLEAANGKAKLYINGVLGISHSLAATPWTKGDGVGIRLTDGALRCSFIKVSTI